MTDDRRRPAPGPLDPSSAPTTLLGFSANQPRDDDMAFERRVEFGDVRPELGQVVRADDRVVLAGRQLAELAERDRLGRTGRPAGVAGALGLERRVAAAGSVSTPTLRLRMPFSSRNATRPRLARSSIAVVSARRDVEPSMTIAPDAAVRSGGGAGMRIDGSSR